MIFISSSQAKLIDKKLLEIGFCIEQLIELAGLSIAHSIYHFYPPTITNNQNPIFLIGPGNNGADGLVAARHLSLFGYKPSLVIAKELSTNSINNSLLGICTNMGIKASTTLEEVGCKHSFIVDAILGNNKDHPISVYLLGFGAKGSLREPYNNLIREIINLKPTILVSIDIPSGWDVDATSGNINVLDKIQPNLLISLTLPKLCSSTFRGKHVLAGNLLTRSIAEELNISNWPFFKPANALFVEL